MKHSLTILIAEDDPDDADLLQMALVRAGINNPLQFVPNGEKAIDYLRGAGAYGDRDRFPFPGVVFCDLQMPEHDGFAVLAWLKNHPDCSVIPFIILSGSDRDEEVKRAYEMGANAYLVKPSRLQDLLEMVKTTFHFWAWCAIPPVPGRSTPLLKSNPRSH